MSWPVREDAQAGNRADAKGSIEGLSDEQLLVRYKDFMGRIVNDTLRMCGQTDPSVREDVWADATMGLLRARKAFDANQGAKFSTYAYYRVKGEVIDGLRRMGYLRRASRSKAALAQAASLLGESQQETVFTARPTHVESLMSLDRTIRSTAAAWMMLQTERARESEHWDAEQPQRQLIAAESVHRVRNGLEMLTETERRIMEGIYYEEVPLRILAEELGYSRSWVCRAHAAALEKLAEYMETH